MKGEVGGDFIITPRCASPLTGSWLLSGTVFPPRPAPEILDYLPPHHRRTSAHEERVRAERHNPHSIATLRITIARQLLRRLACCPFCGTRSG